MKNKIHKIFFSVGEASGDIIASRLINAMLNKSNIHYSFFGIAGENMEKTGKIKSIFPIQDLSVMGYFEVIKKIFKIFYRVFQTYTVIKKLNPDVIITVDSPGFNFLLVRLIKKYAKLQSKIIHCVAPTVWAYKKERAQLCAQLFDHMLVIFPFEVSYFTEVGLKCSYIGNPSIQNRLTKESNSQKQRMLITIFFGSRNTEINQHKNILLKYIREINKKHPDASFFIPTLKNTHKKILSCIKNIKYVDIIVSDAQKQKERNLKNSSLILCKSGTSVLECIPNLVPIISFYKVHPISAWIIKRRLNIKFFTICNIIMNEEVIPELIQENFSLANLMHLSNELLFNHTKKSQQLNKLQIFLDQLSLSNPLIENPSDIINSYLKMAHI